MCISLGSLFHSAHPEHVEGSARLILQHVQNEREENFAIGMLSGRAR